MIDRQTPSVVWMANVFATRFPVRRYEVDQFGFVHTFTLQQYLEEAAIQASAAAGMDPQWYEAHGTVWVVRELTIEFLHPATLDDTLEIRTWVADMRRVRSHREYEIYNYPSQKLLVRASADWVYIDRATLWPMRIPSEAIARFPMIARRAVPPAPSLPAAPRPALEARSMRTVQRHEVDGMGHVNNAIYVTWFEQAALDALQTWLPRSSPTGWPCWRRRHIEYASPVVPGQTVEIVTRLRGLRRACAALHQEVWPVGCGQPSSTDESIVLYLDEQRRPQPWPLTWEGQPA